jgi:hypothetical protein
LLIVPEEIKIQIDEAVKSGITKDDFILWIGETVDADS